MATKQPVKYDAAQHTVFAPGDTLPPGITPVATDGTVGGDGTTGDPLRLDTSGGIPGPAGPPGPEGPAPVTQDSGGLVWTFNSSSNVLGATAVVSPDSNNCLEVRANGLYFACPS